MNIFVDIDDVCLNLMSEWLRLYNEDFNDKLTPHDITEWKIDKFVKPECGIGIYEYLSNANLYKNVFPYPDAIESINYIRDEIGHRVIFATKTTLSYKAQPLRKFHRLNELGFNVKEDDYVEICDKSLLNGEFLLDDNILNVISFRGKGILFSRPHNLYYRIGNRVNTWSEFVHIIEEASRV